MKALLLSILIWTVLVSCKEKQPDPISSAQPGEVAGIITKVDLSALADCNCCTPYQIRIGNDTFQADQLPVSFEPFTTTVWLKYEHQQLSGICNQVQNRINITLIRTR